MQVLSWCGRLFGAALVQAIGNVHDLGAELMDGNEIIKSEKSNGKEGV